MEDEEMQGNGKWDDEEEKKKQETTRRIGKQMK